MQKQLKNEAKVLARLQHTNIVQFFGSFTEEGGNMFIILEFCSGGTLKTLVKRRKTNTSLPVPENEAVKIIRAVAYGVDYMHDHGYLHRDIKPDNILIDNSLPKLADFGLAVHMNEYEGIRAGTRNYYAPEGYFSVDKLYN